MCVSLCSCQHRKAVFGRCFCGTRPGKRVTETLSQKVTEGLSSSGFDSSASFAQESSSADISLLNGLLKDIMLLLDPWGSRQYTHHTGIQRRWSLFYTERWLGIELTLLFIHIRLNMTSTVSNHPEPSKVNVYRESIVSTKLNLHKKMNVNTL